MMFSPVACLQIANAEPINYFQGLEIYFKALEIYFSAFEIYFQALEIVLFSVEKKFTRCDKEVCCLPKMI